jgi:hypothetical protein
VFAGAAAVGLGILVIAPRAGADTLSNNFNGTKSTTAGTSSSTVLSITTEWHHAGRPDPFTTLLTSPDNPSGCTSGTQALQTTASSLGGDGTATSASIDVGCNGIYTWQVSTTYRVINTFTEDGTIGPRTITVAAPPPNVGKLKATASEDGTYVSLSWSEPDNLPPDVTGYKVQRETPTGDYTDLGTVKPGTHSFKDSAPPAGQSELTYVVYAQRTSPNGTLQSPKGSRASVEMPGPTTTTAPGGTTGGGTAGGIGGTGGGTGGGATTGGTGGKGTTGGGSRPATSFGPLNIGKTGAGVAAPNLGRASSDLNSTALPGDEDGGSYDSKLPYQTDSEDGLGGGDSEDGLSSAFYEGGGGRGMAVPIAVGFVFAAWAFHLRFLAKAARPTTRVAPRHGRA